MEKENLILLGYLILGNLILTQAQEVHEKTYPSCYVKKAERAPCSTNDITAYDCFRMGCCYHMHNLTEPNEQRCYRRIATIQDHCRVGLEKRVPCLSWKVSPDLCLQVGCCFDYRSLPTCYHNTDLHYNDDTAYFNDRFAMGIEYRGDAWGRWLTEKSEKVDVAHKVETTTAEVETTTAELETTTAEVETTTAEVETTTAEVETTTAEVETTTMEKLEDIPEVTVTPTPSPVLPRKQLLPTSCVTGERMSIPSLVMEDSLYETKCGSPDHMCWKESYDMNFDGVMVRVVKGKCILPTATFTCDDIISHAAERDFPAVSNCETHSCHGDWCTDMKPEPPTGCSTPDNDVQVFPSCTLSEFLEGTMICLAPYFAGFPNADASGCRSKVDHLVVCQAKVMRQCIQGRCPTALDYVPGLRASYGELRHLTENLESVRDLINRLSIRGMIDTAELVESAYDVLCPNPDELPQVVNRWAYLSLITPAMDRFFTSMGLNIEIPSLGAIIPCESAFFSELTENITQTVTEFSQAQSHEEFCKVYDDFSSVVSMLKNTYCESSDVLKIQKIKDNLQVTTEEAAGYVKAIDVLENFLSKNPRMPNCDATRSCVTGERAVVNGVVYSDSTYKTPCSDGSHMCMIETYDIVNNGVLVNMEVGNCIKPEQVYTCDNVKNWATKYKQGEISNCEMKFCTTDFCSPIATSEPEDCQTPENDIRVFPACTIDDFLDKVLVCFTPYLSGIPYDDEHICSHSFNTMFGCVAREFNTCLGGRCSSAFDDVPGVRSTYSMLRFITNDLEDYEEFLSRLSDLHLEYLKGFVAEIHSQFCIEPFNIDKWMQGVDLPVVLENLLRTVGVNVDMNTFAEFLPCTPGSFNRVKEILERNLAIMGRTVEHSQLCRAYDSFYSEMNDFLGVECNMELEGGGKTMKSLKILHSFFQRNQRLPNCDIERIRVAVPTSCVTGERMSIPSLVMEDSLYETKCGSPDHMCWKESYDMNFDGVMVRVVKGKCILPTATFTCDDIISHAAERDFPAVSNCETHSCHGDWCTDMKPEPPTGCSTRDNDVQVFPSCTLNKFLEETMICLAPYFAGFPYTDASGCRSKVDHLIVCQAKVMRQCVQGRCPTALDYVPGLRASYGELRHLTENLESARDLINRLSINGMIDTAELVESAYDVLCPNPDELPQVVNRWAYLSLITPAMDRFFTSMGLNIEIPSLEAVIPCESAFFSELAQGITQTVMGFSQAQSHEAFCKVYDDFSSVVSMLKNTYCESSDFLKIQKIKDNLQVTTEEAAGYVKTIDVLENFLSKNPRMPNCDSARSCVTGERAMVNGVVYSDSTYKTPCSDGSHMCMIETYDIVNNGVLVNMEVGNCIKPEQVYTCDKVKNWATKYKQGEISNCEMKFCTTDFCSPIATSEPEDCQTPENDIRVFPACTIDDFLDKVLVCFTPYLSGIPYDDEHICSHSFNTMFGCVAREFNKCLEGRCSSAFDDVPGVRSTYSMLRFITKDLENYEEFLSRLSDLHLEYLKGFVEGTHSLFCVESFNIDRWMQGVDLPVVLENLLRTVGVNVDMNTFAEFLPCTPGSFNHLKEILERNLAIMGRTVEHSQLCRAYDSFYSEMNDLLGVECNMKLEGGGTTMKSLKILHSFFQRNQRFPTCDIERICVTGEKTSVGGKVYSDDTVQSVCASNLELCAVERYNLRMLEATVKVEAGKCYNPRAPYSCQDMSQHSYSISRGYGAMEDCQLEICAGNLCTSLQASHKDECETLEDDLQLLPSCTFTETLHSFSSCFAPYISNMPHNNDTICRANADQVISCLAASITRCLSGTCPTILDHITGLRAAYPNLRRITTNIKSSGELAERLDILFIQPRGVEDAIYGLFCPENPMQEDYLKTMWSDNLFVLIQKVFRDFRIKVDPFPTFSSLFPCDTAFSTRFGELQKELVNSIANASDHEQVCRAYDHFTNELQSEEESNCYSDDAEITPFNLFKKFYNAAPRMPGCDKTPTSCVTGERVTHLSDVISDHTVVSICGSPNHVCWKESYDLTIDDSIVRVVKGKCILPTDVYTCDDIISYAAATELPAISNCETHSCHGDLCTDLKPESPSDCSTPDNDVQVFPSCTLSEFLERTMICLAPYFAGFPHTDASGCRNMVNNHLIVCQAKVMGQCIQGRCPTSLDYVPGLRASYGGLRHLTENLESAEHLVNLLQMNGMIDAAELVESAYDVLCPNPDELPQVVNRWAYLSLITPAMDRFFTSMGLNIEIPSLEAIIPCESAFFSELTENITQTVMEFSQSQSHEEFCKVYDDFSSAVSVLQNAYCESSDVLKIQKIKDNLQVTTEEAAGYVKAIDVLENFLSKNPRMPNCDATRSCVTGERSVVNGVVYNDNTYKTACSDGSHICMAETYDIATGGVIVNVEVGACIKPEQVYTCDDVKKWVTKNKQGVISNCEMKFCTTDFCSPIATSEPEDCQTPENDIRIFPSCTLNGFLDKILICFNPYLSHLPYDDQHVCSDSVNQMLGCVTREFNKCLQGRCPSVFDDVPGVRASYSMLRMITKDLRSYEEFLSRLDDLHLGHLSGFVEGAHSMFCSESFSFDIWMQGVDLPVVLENLLQTVGVNVDMNTFAEFLPCTPGTFNNLTEIVLNSLTNMGDSEDHYQLCSAYDIFHGDVSELLADECNMELEGGGQTMKSLKILSFFFQRNWKFPACDNERVCVTGERSYVNGIVYSDNTVQTTCSDNMALCAVERYSLDMYTTTVIVETGQCYNTGRPYTCEDISKYSESRGFGDVRDCHLEICTGNLCTSLQASQEQECETLEDDLQLLPSCTFTETLHSFSSCFAPYISNMPHNNDTICRANADQVISCLAASITRCLSGTCPTILDHVTGLRAAYPVLREISADIKYIGELAERLDILFIQPRGVEDAIYGLFCPENSMQEDYLKMMWSDNLFVLIQKVFRDFRIKVDPFPTFSSLFPCDTAFSTRFGELQKELVNSIASASDHEQVCRAYDQFTNELQSEEESNCYSDDAEITPFNLFKKFYNAAPRMPGCDKTPTSCVTGERVTHLSDVISDHTVVSICGSPNHVCWKESYDLSIDDSIVRIENGKCILPTAMYTCSDIISYSAATELPAISNCETHSCYGDLCTDLKPEPPSDCSTPDNDVQVFPSCTLNKFLEGTMICLAPYFAGFPFTDASGCRSKVDHLIVCQAKFMRQCVQGRCPTALDYVPGLRASYGTIRHLTENLESAEQLVNLLQMNGMIDTAELVESAYDVLCPNPDELPQVVNRWASLSLITPAMDRFFTSMGFNIEIPSLEAIIPCESSFFSELTQNITQTVTEFSQAQSHEEFCIVYDDFSSAVSVLKNAYCESSDVLKIQKIKHNLQVTTEEAAGYVKAIDVLENFLSKNPRMPNCDATRSCVTGRRTLVNGVVYSDSTYKTPCPDGSYMCATDIYDIVTDNVTIVTLENGDCVRPERVFTCDDMKDWVSSTTYIQGEMSRCDITLCSADFCSPIAAGEPEDCQTPENDIQILPSCTLNDSLDKILVCFNPYLSHLPYDDQHVCSDSVIQMLGCVAEEFNQCILGRCSTVLDDVPGVRSSYQLLRMITKDLRSYEDFLSRLSQIRLGHLTRFVEEARSMFCSESFNINKWMQGVDLPVVLENLLQTVGVNVDMNTFAEFLPCTPGSFNNLTEILQRSLAIMGDSEDHYQLCSAYDIFHGDVSELLADECNMELEGGGQTMKSLKILSFFFQRNRKLPACDNERVCVTGERTFVEGKVYSDNTIQTTCFTNMQLCAVERYSLEMDMSTAVNVEFGQCYNPERPYTCEDISKYSESRGYGIVKDCHLEICTGNLCTSLPASQQQECGTLEDDLQLLPSCTFSESLDLLYSCFAPIVSTLHHDGDDELCRENADQFIGCVATSMTRCLSGTCPTILDHIGGLRATYPVLREIVTGIKSGGDLAARLRLLHMEPSGMEGSIYGLFCPENPTQVDHLKMLWSENPFVLIEKLFGRFNMSVAPFPAFSSLFPCDTSFSIRFDELQKELVYSVASAEDKEQACRAYDNFTSALASEEEKSNCSSNDAVVSPFNLLKQFHKNTPRLQGCDGIPRCVTGQLDAVMGQVIADHRVETICSSERDLCTKASFDVQLGAYTLSVTSGECVPPEELQFYTCDGISAYIDSRVRPGAVSSCKVDVCAGDLCSSMQAPAPTNCPMPKDENDFQLFPSCTMQESLDILGVCFSTYLANIPYLDENQCRSDVEHVIVCLAHSAAYCVQGQCPTVLDDLPGVRSEYSVVRLLFKDVKGIHQITETAELLGMSVEILTGLPDFLCSKYDQTSPLHDSKWLKKLDVLGMLNTTLSYVAEDVDIYDFLPCSEEFYDQFEALNADTIIEFLKAKNHTRVCRTYDNFSTQLKSVLKSCKNLKDGLMAKLEQNFAVTREETALTRKAFTMIEAFMSRHPRLPSCDASRTCVTGDVSKIGDYLVADNAVETICPSGDFVCLYEEYDLHTAENYTISVATGQCMHPKKAHLCDAVASYSAARGYGKVSNCRMEVCSTDSCSPLTMSSTEECPVTPDNDLQIFPSCTLSQALDGALACVTPFLHGFPYDEQENCWDHSDEFTKCISKLIHGCLVGNCPTVLDPVPGLRSSYPLLRELKFMVEDKEDLIDKMHLMGLMEAAKVVNATQVFMCPSEKRAANVKQMWLERPRIMKILKQFFKAVNIDIALQPAVCAEMLASNDYPTSETEDVPQGDGYCRIMHDFSNNIVHMLEAGCFPISEDYTRKAMEIFREFGKRSFSCKKNLGRVCVTGDHVAVGEYVIGDNTFPTLCGSPLDDCMVMRYRLQSSEYSVDLTTGVCHDSSYTITCEDLEKYNIQPISNCSIEKCSHDLCSSLTATEPEGCRQHEDDIQLFPQCTVRETLDSLLVCFSPYFSQLPFSNAEACKGTVNGMATCFTKVIQGCLSGRCPTVLDHIPGLRSSYTMLRGALYEAKSIDDIVKESRRMGFGDTADLLSSMIPMMCPEDAEKSEVRIKWAELTDFPMLLQNFLKSFGVTVSVPKFKDILPCDPAFLSLIELLQTQLYVSFDRANSHNDVCKAYDLFSRAFKLLWNQECANEDLVNEENFQKYDSPGHLSNIATVMKVFRQFLTDNPRLGRCDEQRTCVSGERVTVFGAVTEDNTIETACRDNEYLCMSESYVLMIEETPVHIESGKCLDPHQAYICDDVENYLASAGIVKVKNCTITACNSDVCSPVVATPPTDCAPKDIPFLPACSVNEYLDKVEPCVSIFFAGLPYDEENTLCRTNLDKMVSCLSTKTRVCLLGRCPTLLDDIVGLRASYQQIRELLQQVSGIDEIIGRLRGRYYNEAADYISNAQLMLCPHENEKEEALKEWRSQGSFNEMFNRMLATFGFDVRIPHPQIILPCNATYFEKMAYRADAALGEFSAASNHQDICSSYTNFYNSVLALVSENCQTNEDDIMAQFAAKHSKHPERFTEIPSRHVAKALVQFWEFFKRNPKVAKCQ